MDKKPSQLKLKIVWFKNFLGLAIDQVELNKKYPLTPYYFWPRTEAWEQLKLELESKMWLSQEEKISLLKTAENIMNYWLLYRTKKDVKNLKEDFKEVDVIISHN